MDIPSQSKSYCYFHESSLIIQLYVYLYFPQLQSVLFTKSIKTITKKREAREPQTQALAKRTCRLKKKNAKTLVEKRMRALEACSGGSDKLEKTTLTVFIQFCRKRNKFCKFTITSLYHYQLMFYFILL